MTNDRVTCHSNQDKYIQSYLASVLKELSSAAHGNGKRNIQIGLFIILMKKLKFL